MQGTAPVATGKDYRAEAVKALHLHLLHSWDTPVNGPADVSSLITKAGQFVDAAALTATSRIAMLTVGSEVADRALAAAVVSVGGVPAIPTAADIEEARRVIQRLVDATDADPDSDGAV